MRLFSIVMTLVVLMTASSFGDVRGCHKGTSVIETKGESTQKTTLTSQVGSLRIPFIANEGQYEEQVRYSAHTFGGQVYITSSGEIIYTLPKPIRGEEYVGVALLEEFVGVGACDIAGGGMTETKMSCFKGADVSKWWSDIRTFDWIDLGEIYDGICVTLKAYGNTIEKLFVVDPDADPGEISLRFSGADFLSVNDAGELEVYTELGVITFSAPIAFQKVKGVKEYVAVSYVTEGFEYGFSIGPYDRKMPLIIDPLLVATFLGGNGTEGGDEFWWIWTDMGPDGSVYIAGMTSSQDFPRTPGAYETDFRGNYDIFVSKLEGDLTTLSACAIIGGSGFDRSWDITVDDGGEVYVSGITQSPNYPTTPGAYDGSRAGSSDACVSKLSGDLTTLLSSTYLGGNGYEGRVKIVLDDHNNIFVTGTTDHNSFPTTPGAYDESYNGGSDDFFVSKLDRDLASLLASTFLGGMYHEWWPSITIDEGGNIFVAGSSGSHDFPVSAAAYDPSFNGDHSYGQWNLDVFVSKLNNDLTALLASTFLGADDYEGCLHLSLDEATNVYVSGHTWDTNFPTTPGVLDEEFSGDEYFISKLDRDLSALLASTFTTPNDAGLGHIWDMKADGRGNLLCCGTTPSPDFPTTLNGYDVSFNGGTSEAYLMKLDDDLTALVYSTFLGGSGEEGASSMTIDENGDVYVAGYTNSSADFPLSSGAYDDTYNGGASDCFVAKFTFDQFTRIFEGDAVSDLGSAAGLNWIDYNNDAYQDLFVPMQGGLNRLYRNNGDGSFTRITDDAIVSEGGSNGSSWGDYDNDGDLDAYVTNGIHMITENFFYLNNGDESFTKGTDDIIVTDRGASFLSICADYDNDGALDIFVADHGTMPPSGPCYDQLYHGHGDGQFTKITEGVIVTDAVHSSGASWADYDNDGDQDLFVIKYEAGDVLFRNEGDTFTRITDGDFLSESRAVDFSWGDYDNDGDLDLFVASYQGFDNALYENRSADDFLKITGQDVVTDGGWSTSSCWGDFDNDGDLDLYVVNDNPNGSNPDVLYTNGGNGQFYRSTESTFVNDPGVSGIVGAADYDRDGDLDLYLTNWYNDQPNLLYRNNGNANNWSNIACVGTISNRSAIGAKIRLKANMKARPTWQLRTINPRSGGYACSSLNAHFGLADATVIDSIKVEWPSGMVDILTNVPVNQFLTITEAEYGDRDGDGIADIIDNCPDQANPGQADSDTDGVGDACDNCLDEYNPDQDDADGDTLGDACDLCTDTDGDGHGDPGYPANTCQEDICPEVYNPGQEDVERGDINCDDGIDVLDILAVVNHILGNTILAGGPLERADCNGDGGVNVLDALSIVNVILGIGECSPSCRPIVTADVVRYCESLKQYLHREDFSHFMSLVHKELSVPSEYTLSQNYPNPFNPDTEIQFGLPRTSKVTLTVYNVLGQIVEVLVDSELDAGYHGIRWDGSDLTSVVYFYRLMAGDFTDMKKMMLIK
ncbi:MAG: VCBS repeat-containing protein [Gemmatimonadota bacterium]|nr:MAG: VCBS repeat-containing protein [Gemmatimonadota bacterium]